MSKSTIGRLSEYMSLRGINNNMLTVTAGLSIGQIGKAIANNSGVNSSSVEKILKAYPELNSEWLLTGKGEMLKKSTRSPNVEPLEEIAPTRKHILMAHESTNLSKLLQSRLRRFIKFWGV